MLCLSCVLLCRTLVKAAWVTEQPQITDSWNLHAEIFTWLNYRSGLQLMPSLVSAQFTSFTHLFLISVVPVLYARTAAGVSHCISYLGEISPCPGCCSAAPRQSSKHQLVQGSSPCVSFYFRACNRARLELLVTCAQIIPVKWLNSAVHAGTVLVNKCMEAQSSKCAKDSLNVSCTCKYLGSFKC